MGQEEKPLQSEIENVDQLHTDLKSGSFENIFKFIKILLSLLASSLMIILILKFYESLQTTYLWVPAKGWFFAHENYKKRNRN